jgi:hypothetical protein
MQRTAMAASDEDPCAMEMAHSTKKSFHGMFEVTQPALKRKESSSVFSESFKMFFLRFEPR